MPTIRLQLPRLHDGQLQIAREALRFNVVDCGRRFGKTTFGIDRAVHPILNGYPVGLFYPTYKNLLEVWREFNRILAPIIRSKSEQDHRIETITNGILDMWSLERPQSIKGRKYKVAILDEAAIIPNLENTWQEVIRPTLTDYRGGAWFLSTPQGTQNYFYKLFQRGDESNPLHKDFLDWKSWKMPTWTNPYISRDEIDAAQQELPEHIFAQEYGAEFRDAPGGLIFDTWKDDSLAGGNISEQATYIPGAGYVVWAADDGYVGEIDKGAQLPTATSHPRVFLLAQIRQDGRLVVFAEHWALNTLPNVHIQQMLDLSKERGWPLPDYVAVDSAAATLRAYINEVGFVAVKASHPVEEGIKLTRSLLAADANGIRHTTVHPSCRLLRHEMSRYARDLNGAIIKQYDHACDTLRYLHYSIRSRG